MAELCFSVDDFVLFFFTNFSNTSADTASEYDSYGHRRCWTAAASCPYYSCRRRAKPVGIVLPCVCFVLVLVAVRFGLWTMMAELCISVDDFI